MVKPAIVISAFDRPRSLRRLLDAINSAIYPSNDIELVISIDGEGDSEVMEWAEAFHWKHGTKNIIRHSVNLGLKQHIISCGELTKKYGAIIVLEDDIEPSPYFYQFVQAALPVYENDDSVAGISLYSYRVSESDNKPFDPIEDGKDVYLMQVASSWGQVWSDGQWSMFKGWLDDGAKTDKETPDYLDGWSEQSWKKKFIAYLIDSGRWFVYPRVSLTTNHEDPGEHGFGTSRYQVPVLMGEKQWQLPRSSDIKTRYNAWFQPVVGLENHSSEGAFNSSADTFSIWVNVLSIQETVESLKSIQLQNRANIVVYLATEERLREALKAKCNEILGESVHWKVVTNSLYGIKRKLLSIATISLEIDSGDQLVHGAIECVSDVFQQFPNLAMLLGLPENERTVDHRWNADLLMHLAKNKKKVPSILGVFRKVHTIEQQEPEIPELMNLLTKYQLHLITRPLILRSGDRDLECVENHPAQLTQSNRPAWKRFLTILISKLYPNSELYTFVSGLPDVIRYDNINKTYYLSRS